MSLAASYVEVQPDTRGFGTRLDRQLARVDAGPAGRRAGSSFVSGFSGSLGALGALGAKAVGGLSVALATAGGFAGALGIKTAAANETATIAFTTMLGSGRKAQAFLRELQAFAAATPFEFPELQTAASSLIAIGIDARKVIPIMTTLGNVTSGMGTGSEGIKRATVALQQMNAAGRITAEDLNQLRDAGIPVFDLLAGATGKSKEQLAAMAQNSKLGRKELEQLMKALETGKGLERFNGLKDKQSQSLSGLWATFKDVAAQNLAQAVQPLIPLLKDGLGGAATFLQENLPKVTRAMKWLIEAGMQAYSILFRNDFKGGGPFSEDSRVVDILFNIRDGFVAVVRFIRDDAIPALVATGTWLNEHVVPAVKATGRWLRDDLWPAMQAVAGFLDRTFRPAFESLVTTWRQWVIPAINTVRTALEPHMPLLRTAAKLVGGMIVAWLAFQAKVAAVVLPVLGRLAGFLIRAFADAVKLAIKVVGWLVDKGVAVVQKFREARDWLGKFRDRLGEIKLPAWVQKLADLMGSIADKAKSGAGKLAAFFGVGDGPGRPPGGGGGGATLARVRPIVSALGLGISSTYRSAAQNAAAGGSPTSYHMDRRNPAVDIVGPAWKLDRLYTQLRAMGGWRELLWRVAGHYDHLHVADTGSLLRSGHGAVNLSGRPERVLSPAQTEAFDRLVALLEEGASVRTAGPRTLIIVDKDGDLIGRMRVEAGDVLDEELASARWGQD
jgi:tape measure domain-containing protein